MTEDIPLAPEFADDLGAQAAKRLFNWCFRHVGSGTVPVAQFLVSLHDADLACPDAYLLCRRIEDRQFEDVLTVMRWFRDMPGKRDLYLIFGRRGSGIMERLLKMYGYI